MSPMPGEREAVNDHFPEEMIPTQKGEKVFQAEEQVLRPKCEKLRGRSKASSVLHRHT